MPKLMDAQQFADYKESLSQRRSYYTTSVTICAGTACQACGCLPVANALDDALKYHGFEQVYFRKTGCHGFCDQGPLVIIEPGKIFYSHVKVEDVHEIVNHTLKNGEIIERLLYVDPVTGKQVTVEDEIPFYSAQNRLLLGENRYINPAVIDDYILRGGYSSLMKVLQGMSPDDIINEIKASGLRGRGGGGYPTGRKWEQCRKAEGTEKYVICNADEGDPGAYMDRSLLEGNPHAIIEGMLIGAYAIGAKKGYVYVRNEYPLAVIHIKTALEQAQELGLLGENILGSGLDFDIKVVRGGGAFVCGESTALMASLEGKVGEPRAKDVHTVEKGFLEQPSNLNNVETWANVPLIINQQASWYSNLGTANSKGTKIFALTGQVKNVGLIEVEMGTTLRKIIYNIGGGPKNGKQIKAVQTGGPSGGCLPERLFDLPVDFDELVAADSMMGSGGLVVMDDSACMVDVARYFCNFLLDESCGKCVPCRLGLDRMKEILTDIAEGRGRIEQLELLEELAWTMSLGSLCALGKTAANPVISTLKYFRDEYEAHIKDKHCPAGVCKELVRYVIDEELCSECGLCFEECPHDAIHVNGKYSIDDEACVRCGVCLDVCPSGAIQRI